ncbi:MAG: hypothetical protein L5655_08060, partial [Thermosediminibacteraceae bacterium]|nr:hypothetical protein [Thermosediminibacteraceae bacterium]
MKRFVLVAMLFSFCILLLGGCRAPAANQAANVGEEIKKLENKILELEEELHSKELDIKYLKEERDYYRKFIDSVLEKMTEAELREIVKKEWWYTLSIRYSEEDKNYVSINFPENGRVVLDKSNFEVVLSEHNAPFPIVDDAIKYKKIYDQVRLRNKTDHIKIMNYDNYEIAAGS